MLPLLVRFLATCFRLHSLGILPSTLLHRITRTARRRYGVEVTCYVELYSAENLKSRDHGNARPCPLLPGREARLPTTELALCQTCDRPLTRGVRCLLSSCAGCRQQTNIRVLSSREHSNAPRRIKMSTNCARNAPFIPVVAT